MGVLTSSDWEREEQDRDDVRREMDEIYGHKDEIKESQCLKENPNLAKD